MIANELHKLYQIEVRLGPMLNLGFGRDKMSHNMISRVGALLALGLVSCQPEPPTVARDNHVFYDKDALNDGCCNGDEPEIRVPEFDRTGELGVQIVRGGARLVRPQDWTIQSYSNEPTKAFISYVSGRQFTVTIFERVEAADEPWSVVLDRYLKEVESDGAKVLWGPAPRSVYWGQARAFRVRREVETSFSPMPGITDEYLVRGQDRFILVQASHRAEPTSAASQEILQVINSIRVR